MRIIFIIFSLYSFNLFSQDEGHILPLRLGGLWSINKDGVKLHEANLDISLSKGNGYYMSQVNDKPILQVSTDKDGNMTYLESSDLYEHHFLYKFDAQKKLLQFSECRAERFYKSGNQKKIHPSSLCYQVNEKVCEMSDKAAAKINLDDVVKCNKMQFQVLMFNNFMNSQVKEDAILNKEIDKLKEMPNKYKTFGEIRNRSSYIANTNLGFQDQVLGLATVLGRCNEFRRMGLLPSENPTSKNTKARSGANKQ